MDEYFVYILRSVDTPEKVYVGVTADINQRLTDHNNKTQIYTSRYAPRELVTFVTFNDRQTAADFEKYLKSQSGRSFMHKRLIPS